MGEAVGEVELSADGVLILRRIHVQLRLQAPESQHETAARVHGFFADKCPVYRSLKDAMAITTGLTLEPEPGESRPAGP